MHENFIALEKEKRDRIINAAMREFAAKGYKNASTNEIVKEAGISKGALFHYFESKADLFEFLYSYGINFFMDATKPHIKHLPADVFERWTAFSALKMRIAAQYPDMSDFMKRVYGEDMQKSGELMLREYERYSESFRHLIYDGIDLSKFKPDIDVSKALGIIWWVLEGYAMSKLKEGFEFNKNDWTKFQEALVREMEEYLLLLKKSFYREDI